MVKIKLIKEVGFNEKESLVGKYFSVRFTCS